MKELTAEQARLMATTPDEHIINGILLNIENAAKSGKMESFEYYLIKQKHIMKLEGLGFKVSNLSDQRDGICFRISWNQ